MMDGNKNKAFCTNFLFGEPLCKSQLVRRSKFEWSKNKKNLIWICLEDFTILNIIFNFKISY